MERSRIVPQRGFGHVSQLPKRRDLDSVESLWVAALVERIGSLSGSQMREICRPLEVATDCE